MRVTIFGAGAWGSALAIHVGARHDVLVHVRDPAQAQLWYNRAAQQGLTEAQQALGVLLLSGAGGTTDPTEGYKWLLLAERGGRPDASAAREKLADKVSDRDRRRAEALAQAFKPTSELPRDDGQPRLMAPRR